MHALSFGFPIARHGLSGHGYSSGIAPFYATEKEIEWSDNVGAPIGRFSREIGIDRPQIPEYSATCQFVYFHLRI
jgi:hypothetical protein